MKPVLVVALLLVSTRVWAHHAFAAEYDEHKVVTVSGTVQKIEWSNPHAWLYVAGKDDKGKATVWRFEMGSPGGMKKRGWTLKELKKGDAITVDGFGSKKSAKVANARTVTLADGEKKFAGFATTPGAPGK